MCGRAKQDYLFEKLYMEIIFLISIGEASSSLVHQYSFCRDFATQSSSSGFNLQVGTETEVTANIKLGKVISLGATKTIPQAFTRAWADSRGMKSLEEFFSKKKGMVALTLGSCTMYEVFLNTFHLPPFRESFKVAIKDLHKAASQSAVVQRAKLVKFISQYGTHFLLRARMGAQFMHLTKYSEITRRRFTTQTLEACNQVSGSKVFGIQIEKDKKQCSSSDQDKLKELGRNNVEEVIITKGSRPTDIKNWVKQEFTPNPLQFQLSPIVNLFTDKHLAGIVPDSFTIRKWFLPLYYDYCRTFGIESECLQKKGCGYDDLCPLNTICVGSGTVHQCSRKFSY